MYHCLQLRRNQMENLFAVIRKMVSDSRMIAIHTGVPQYKVQQVKSKLFHVAESQNKAVCDWWLRLYRREYSRTDLEVLIKLTEGKKLEEIWIEDIEEGASELEY